MAMTAAGIDADVTREQSVATVYAGGPLTAIIWVDDDADLGIAEEIITQATLRMGENRCLGCGFDLRGHIGEAICPECGRRVYAPEGSTMCRECGEECPGSFEVCWNCGCSIESDNSVDARSSSVLEDSTNTRPSARRIVLILIAIGIALAVMGTIIR